MISTHVKMDKMGEINNDGLFTCKWDTNKTNNEGYEGYEGYAGYAGYAVLDMFFSCSAWVNHQDLSISEDVDKTPEAIGGLMA